MKRIVSYGCAAGFLLAMVVFFCLAIIAGIMTVSARAPEHVPDSLNSGTYSVVYDSALLIPISADWRIDSTCLGEVKRVPSWRFTEDVRVPHPRATHDDYTNSGYDRGHMCPAADRSRSVTQMRTTFLMTNVCPQSPALNRGAWKRMEDECRGMAKTGVQLAVHVDVVFWHADTQRIGAHGVAVPHGFVKSVREVSTDSLLVSKYFQNE